MTALEPPDRSRLMAAAAIIAFVVAVLLFQLLDLGRSPLNAWDESRLAVNAIEMLQSGEHIVTTYDFRPDLWNTKPPLVINLMAWSMQLFGTTVYVLRLPSALATCATILVVVLGVRRTTRSLGCGIAAGALLAGAPLFYGYHGGATGDYDAILTLFTTAYGFVLFDLIERDRASPRVAVVAGVLIAFAILTKGIAGIIPGVGIAVYAAIFAFRSLPRKLGDYAISLAIPVAIGGLFYWLRDASGGGYLAAVAFNELGGRFGTSLDQHTGNRWFYLRELTLDLPGRLWPALAFLPLVPTGPIRRLAIFELCQVAGIVVIYSSAATKISWYIVPALPCFATALALIGLGVFRAARRFSPGVQRGVGIALAALVVACSLFATVQRYSHPFVPQTPPRAFDALIAAAAERRMVPLAVVDSGFPNGSGLTNYAPTLRFYALAVARHGIAVAQVTGFTALGSARFFGSCDPAIRNGVATHGTPVWSGSGCILAAR